MIGQTEQRRGIQMAVISGGVKSPTYDQDVHELQKWGRFNNYSL